VSRCRAITNKNMRIALLLIGLACLLASGCQLIPTDMFPKATWYWSKEARQYRHDKEIYGKPVGDVQRSQTNSPTQ
jgi:hypothetical protein